MQDISIQELPQEYNNLKDQIDDETIQRLYSNFTFLFHSTISREVPNNNDQQIKTLIESYFLAFLQNFKFITFHIIKNSNNQKTDSNSANQLDLQSFSDVVFCVERQCLLIEKIDISTLQKIIHSIKEQNISIINVDSTHNFYEKTKEEQEAEVEINNFCFNFRKLIKTNKFVELTIRALIGYTIRRHFYPTQYFQDQSFFHFESTYSKEEKEIKSKLSNFMFSKKKEEREMNHKKLKDDILILSKDEIYNYEFKESDFIILRSISANRIASYNLVFHLKSFYIFFMKRMSNSIEDSHEFEFCKKYSNRCFTPFYGFLRENRKIIGFIYEFMSNGSLYSFMLKNEERVSNLLSLMTINRILQGIGYLHSNSLVHRDIKPSNIFLDHDFVPFFSDNETIRHPSNELEKMTIDIGSELYSSPEQEQGKLVSYSTDIYSFGLVIFYLFEKKHLRSEKYVYSKDTKNKFTKNIQFLIDLCIKESPTERPSYQEIKKYFIEKVNPFDYLIEYLNNDVNTNEVIQLIFEYIILLNDNKEKLNKFLDILFNYQYIFITKLTENESSFLFTLGNIYENGYGVIQDIKKAIELYERSASKENSEAFCCLAKLYLKGKKVDKDYSKAKEYFEYAARLKNSNGFFYLGFIYENGLGVEQNFLKAKAYYELSSKLNNSNALYNIGILYMNGLGVKQNQQKAIEYFESSAKLNNSDSFWILGLIYAKGYGVEQNYIKAKEYYELAIKQNHPDALYDLGNFYFHGYGVEKNIQKAIEYFELSANEGNTEAMLALGFIYNTKYAAQIDYIKAKEYYELAIKHGDSRALFYLGNLYLDDNGIGPDYKKAKEYFELSASQDNSLALFYLGKLYFNGIGVEKDYTKAIKYIQSAADKNNPEVFAELGNLYLHGMIVEQDYLTAKQYYELASKENNSNALYHLGYLYLNGLSVEKNYLKAKKYFELAAEQNNSDALVYLGHLYENGLGVEKNYSKAKEFYELATKNKNSKAFCLLGYLYKDGYGVEKNYLKAKECFNLSSQEGDSFSFCALGEIYYFGEGVEKDYKKAKYYYEIAANMGDPEACFTLGTLYNNGLGVEKDYNKAKYYYELAAKQDNSEALNNLGVLYEYGQGVDKNYNKAREYYELSAKLENSDAINNLGLLYENGLGVKIDYLKAKKYYELASNYDNSEALLNLGNLYTNGLGVKKDYLKAKKYFELSAEQGESEAFLNLGILYENGNGVKQSYKKANNNYLQSAKLENSDANINLAKLYYNGNGVEQDYKKAKEYYEIAAQQNNPEALFFLGYLYSLGEIFECNFEKSIQFYLKCIEIKSGNVEVFNYVDSSLSLKFKYNYFYYRSFNDLGLIYLIVYNDLDKAIQCIKEAAFNEYPFGQNNYALLCQFYLNKIGDAEYMFKKASKSKFAISEYNLGFLNESIEKVDESIKYYIKASEDEDEPLLFHNIEHDDKRLEISKIFIISLTNLKLTEYFLMKENFEDSKEYFIKLISGLEINTEETEYYFKFKFNDQKDFKYLKSFILNYPLFNLLYQPHLKPELRQILVEINNNNEEEKSESNDDEKIDKSTDFSKKNSEQNDRILKNENEMKSDNEKQSNFDDPGDFFDFIDKNTVLKNYFIKEIREIINLMNEILYTPPYDILLGRICLEIPKRKKQENNSQQENVDASFYDGLNLNI